MKLGRFLLSLALVAACVAAVLLTDIPAWLKYKKGDVKDYNLAEAGELKKGDLVQGTVDMSLGPCAEEYNTTYGVRSSDNSSKLYYVLWMDSDQLIVYETSASSDYAALDRIADETVNYFKTLNEGVELGDMAGVQLPTSTLEIQGRVTELPSDIKGWFKELYDKAFEDDDFEKSAEPVMITRVQLDRLGMLVIIGAGCAVLAIVLLAAGIAVMRREKANLQQTY